MGIRNIPTEVRGRTSTDGRRVSETSSVSEISPPPFPLFDARKFCYRDRRVIDVRQVQGSNHG